jgi:hypothetical protein
MERGGVLRGKNVGRYERKEEAISAAYARIFQSLERTLRVKLNAQFYEGWSFIDWADAAAQQRTRSPD